MGNEDYSPNVNNKTYGGNRDVSSTSDDPVRMPEIMEQMSELQMATDRAHETLSKLTGRIEGVLSPQEPSGEAKAIDRSRNTQLGEAIFIQCGQVERLTSRMNDLLRRVEV